MTEFLDRGGLSVDSRLVSFIEDRAIPGTGVDAAAFWTDFGALLARFAPENAALLAKREELQAKIFGNMSERASQLIREDMEYMGPVRVSDVEAAQQRIVDIVRRLEEAGEIIIAGRGGAEELIV